MKLLIVEDDPVIAMHVGQSMRALGHEAELAATGEAGLEALRASEFDAIVLDRLLPGLDGLGVLRKLQQHPNQPPVLMLSALGMIDERVEGLDAGADDYLVKPFEMTELMARLNAIVRRGLASADTPRAPAGYQVGALSLDLASHGAVRGTCQIDLNRKEFSLLAELMRATDQVVTRRMLLENIWGYSFEPSTNIIESNMSRLRAKLALSGQDPIETVRGAGYILRSALC